jgi:hypothetical protein
MLGPTLAGVGGADTLAPRELWAAAWPVGLGAALALGVRHLALPALPEGDIVVLGKGVSARARGVADALERADARLSEWSIAGISLLALAILLGAAMLAGR